MPALAVTGFQTLAGGNTSRPRDASVADRRFFQQGRRYTRSGGPGNLQVAIDVVFGAVIATFTKMRIKVTFWTEKQTVHGFMRSQQMTLQGGPGNLPEFRIEVGSHWIGYVRHRYLWACIPP